MTAFNSSLFESNLAAFLMRYPQDRERFSFLSKTSFQAGFDLRESPEGLELKRGEKKVDSLKASKKLSLSNQGRPARIVVLEGFGLGSTLTEILKIRKTETKDIFIVEPSAETFLMAMGAVDLREQISDSSIHWIMGLPQNAAFYRIFSLLRDQERSLRISSRVYVRHPFGAGEARDYFEAIEKDWETHIETVQNFLGSSFDAIVGLRNTFENLKFIEDHPGVDLLKDSFLGKSAIVVSTGPSLLRSIEGLRRAQSTSILIAADASLKILLDHGINPHFVTTLERSETEPFFRDLKFPNPQIKPNLVACPLAPKEALELYSGPKWVTYRAYDYYGYFSGQARKGWLLTGHSVANLSVGLAVHLGCKRIAFVGQDLSYDPDTMASHPKGISYEEWSQNHSEESFKKTLAIRGEDLFWVKGNKIDKVPTSSIYVVYMQELLDLIQSLPEIQFTNCTEGGAKIGDLNFKSLEEFILNEKLDTDVFQRVAAFYKSYPRDARIQVGPIREYLQQAMGYLRAGLDVAKSSNALDRIQDLRHLQNELKKDRPFFAFVVHQMARATAELEDEWNLLPDADQKSNPKRLEILSKWFEKSMKIAEEVERSVPQS